MITVPMQVAATQTSIPMQVSTLTVETPLNVNAAYQVTGGVDLPEGGNYGDLLAKRSDKDFDTEWVTPANSAEQDNTRPITAAAVYTEIGNINALLATI